MDEVKVRVAELLDVLRKNREGHREKFERAQEVYRGRVIEWLDEELRRASQGETVRTSINLPEPVDYTDAYDEAIRMLEMSVDDTVEITQRDVKRYVMDRWEWAEHFAANTTAYLAE
jgi:hypothetical protein